jgi:hypothetical protein
MVERKTWYGWEQKLGPFSLASETHSQAMGKSENSVESEKNAVYNDGEQNPSLASINGIHVHNTFKEHRKVYVRMSHKTSHENTQDGQGLACIKQQSQETQWSRSQRPVCFLAIRLLALANFSLASSTAC